MILAQPAWEDAITKITSDRTGLGILTATTIRATSADILLLGTYWSTPNKTDDNPQSITVHVDKYIQKKERYYKGSSLDWVVGCIGIGQFKHIQIPTDTFKHKHISRRLQRAMVPRQRRHKRPYSIMGNSKRLEKYNRRTIALTHHILCNEIHKRRSNQ